jgi:hypothetical protein
MLPENIPELPDRNFQNIVIVVISWRLVSSIMNELFDSEIVKLGFEPLKSFGFLTIVIFLL